MTEPENEELLLRSVALQNATAIQAARQRAELELSLIYANVSDVIFNIGIEPDGGYRFLSVNPAFLAATGLAMEQVVGKRLQEVIPTASVPLVLERYATAIRERRTVRWEETSEYRAGRKVGLVSVTPIFDASGSCINLIGTVHDITQRKQEEEFRARLAAVVESSDDAIVSKTLEGIITTWNIGAQRIFGYEADEVINKPITLLIPAERLDEEARIIERLKRGERIEHFETVRMHKDGTPLDISLSVSPIKDSTGRVIGAAKIARDITMRKRLEQALRENAERLALAMAAADLGDWNWDAATDVISLSQRGADMFGIPVYPPITRTAMRDLIHEEDRDNARLANERAGAERREYDVEYRVNRPDGRQIWVAAKGRGMYDADGTLIRMLGVVQDITERKRIEREQEQLLQKVESEHARLAEALMQSPAFMCILGGPQHYFEFVNEQYYRLIGPRDILNKSVAAALPEVRGQGFLELLDAVYQSGQPRTGKEVPLLLQRTLDQPLEQRYLDFVYQPLFDASDCVSGIFVHGIDVTDKKKADEAREQLLEAERAARAEAERVSVMKDEFLATLSHELRTPLNAILGWSQILGSRQHLDEELAEGLSVIERNTRVQTQLIGDLLDMSRIISGKIRLDVQQVDLQEVVKAAVASVQHSADAKEIRLQVVLDPLVPPVRGDPGRLQQCFWNLLSNAIKFTPRGGRVQVSLERVNSHLEVCVADNGQGIKPDFLPHLFERFRQADSSTTRRHDGLGLGLSIVKNLVELHGGTVRAKSAGEGMGATLCIELPVMVAHPAEATHSRVHPGGPTLNAPAIDHPSLAGITVLAVDDEADARHLLKRVLEGCGAKVFLAGSSREGLDLVQSERPDMIVSDIGMPVEDGYEFIRKVRLLAFEDGGRTPAAALTAFARAEDRTRALRAGYQTHVAKPVEPTELTAVVASLAIRR
jgi:PAS domain S-box-containing protein